MTVRELIAKLQEYDPEAVVVMSSDREGNGHSPLDEIDASTYVPDTTWSGELWDPEYDEADPEDEDAWERPANAVPCVCLWPVN